MPPAELLGLASPFNVSPACVNESVYTTAICSKPWPLHRRYPSTTSGSRIPCSNNQPHWNSETNLKYTNVAMFRSDFSRGGRGAEAVAHTDCSHHRAKQIKPFMINADQTALYQIILPIIVFAHARCTNLKVVHFCAAEDPQAGLRWRYARNCHRHILTQMAA